MSKRRQSGSRGSARDVSRRGFLDRMGDRHSDITPLVHDYPAGYVIPLHFHQVDQLVYATRGVMTVRSSSGAWVVPTYRGVWIPAAVAHTITMSGPVAMRTLYLRSGLAKSLPRECCVVNVSALLRELILHACNFATLKRKVQAQRHLVDLILDQLKEMQTVPLQLPNPTDARAKRVAEALLAEPGDSRPVAEICKAAGASKRTVERLFQEQVGMTFGKWRQQVRLMEAMRLLAEGAKVTHAAVEAGYSTPSAFISMFRKALGTTPRGYFKGSEGSKGR